MHAFDWNNYDLFVDLTSYVKNGHTEIKPKLELDGHGRPRSQVFRDFIQFFEEQDIHGLQDQLQDDNFVSHPSFEFMFDKLLSNLKMLPESLAKIINDPDSHLIGNANQKVRNLLTSLILANEFENLVQRMSQLFSANCDSEKPKMYKSISEFYREMFRASIEHVKFFETQTKLEKMVPCSIGITIKDTKRAEEAQGTNEEDFMSQSDTTEASLDNVLELKTGSDHQVPIAIKDGVRQLRTRIKKEEVKEPTAEKCTKKRKAKVTSKKSKNPAENRLLPKSKTITKNLNAIRELSRKIKARRWKSLKSSKLDTMNLPKNFSIIRGPNGQLPKFKSEIRYACHMCGKGYRLRDLDDHYLTHSKEKQFECPKCKNGFKSMKNLKRHLLVVCNK